MNLSIRRNKLGFLLIGIILMGWGAVKAQPGALQTISRDFKGHKLMGNGGTYVPEWQDTIGIQSAVDTNLIFAAPNLQSGHFDEKVRNLPFYVVRVPLAGNEEINQISSVGEQVKTNYDNLFSQSVREAKLEPGTDYYPSSHVVKGPRVIERKKAYQLLYIYPIRVSRSGREQIVAERVNFSFSKKAYSMKTAGTERSYKSSSVLGNGEWFKIGIVEEGIYQLDYNFFSDLGINISNVDPRTIKIYGNGGGMLPQVIGEYPYDDLEENAITVAGESDGNFDQGDYVLFYGDSPHDWEWREQDGRYKHYKNLYSDTTFYFLTFNQGNGKRIPSISSDPNPNHTPSYTLQRTFHEEDLYNPLLSGRSWLGENFDLTTQRRVSFSAPYLAPGTDMQLTYRLGGRATSNSNFNIAENGTLLGTSLIRFITTSYGSINYRTNWGVIDIPSSQISDGSVDIDLEYLKPNSSAIGYLDYLELQYRQQLNTGGANRWFWNAVENVGPGQIFSYSIAGGSGDYQIWDITDPINVRKQNFTLSGNNMVFSVKADSVKRFVAFRNGQSSPASVEKIPNQDLHNLAQADFLIVTHPEFVEQAYRLQDFHRNQLGQTVHVVDINRIYNEFSSGKQDPTAIRDFVNMFYVRAGTDYEEMPKYLLLFGDGSYDYKGRVSTTFNNFIPTYQSRNSYDPPNSYTSDDFYGIQDTMEGNWGENAAKEANYDDILFPDDTLLQTQHIDVAVGRLPVKTQDEARDVVDKIISYGSDPATFGAWKNRLMLVADYKPGEYQHTTQSNSFTSNIQSANECINIDKIFLDNYQRVNTADGYRFPEAKDEMMKRMNEGCLIVNYTGHGGETGWSNAKILEIPDIASLENTNRYPAFITATCEFGRWDDPGRVAGAEHLFLADRAGAIALFTTVRVVYSTPNTALNRNFYKYALSPDTALDRMHTLGEINLKTKNDTWPDGRINTRNFTLLGDPALTLAYPEYEAVVTSINGTTVTAGVIDSLPSLTKVTVEGEVRDANGVFQSSYNGNLSVTVFDKPSRFVTKTFGIGFNWQKNRIFNGLASVNNGRFNFEFVVPLDVSYEPGTAKISLYLENGITDGSGCHADIYVGGTDTAAIEDDRSPEISLFMNDAKFSDGQMVGPSPTMIAELFDENGINTVGTGIGHELVAVLDDNDKDVILLNDFYTAAKDNYREGRIEYPFETLPTGEHNLRVKVWDVANNSAESEVNFVVSDNAEVALGHVVNYPNPFTTNTKFIIEHNQDGYFMDCTVKIFTVSGTMVKALEGTFFAEGNLYCDLEWDGLDEWGDVLGRGVYVYQVTLRNQETGEQVSTFEKLVLLR